MNHTASNQERIEEIFDLANEQITLALQSAEVIRLISSTIDALDRGDIKVVEHKQNKFVVHSWVKKAILLHFRASKMKLIEVGDFRFFDKIEVKAWRGNEGVRVVPPAFVRRGAYVSKGAILMPSYVNIGAFVGPRTMVDTWATVGSCAYIGANVHLSGGVGIGGVLEPVQAQPVIVEDGAFIGSRAILVEGVHVEARAVIAAGVTITGSTKIIDVTGSKPVTYQGRVPAGSVVIPGTTQKQFAAGSYGVPCALIIGQRKTSTDEKTSLTDALREFDVAT